MSKTKFEPVSVSAASALLGQRARTGVSIARKYTYIVEGDCGDGSRAKLKWKLRDNRGTFDEDWCDISRDGKLAFAGDAKIDIGLDQPVEGWAYNGSDEYADVGYVFGSREYPEYGGYIVLMGDPYVDDASYVPYYGLIAQRKNG
jgi:hypothetical protein